MDKTTIGVVTAMISIPALGAGSAARAGTIEPPSSYGELFEPVTDAAAILQRADLAAASAPARLVPAQYFYHHHHHHHHHHHAWAPEYYPYGYGYSYAPRYRYYRYEYRPYYWHHHHHHHHHHWNGGDRGGW